MNLKNLLGFLLFSTSSTLASDFLLNSSHEKDPHPRSSEKREASDDEDGFPTFNLTLPFDVSEKREASDDEDGFPTFNLTLPFDVSEKREASDDVGAVSTISTSSSSEVATQNRSFFDEYIQKNSMTLKTLLKIGYIERRGFERRFPRYHYEALQNPQIHDYIKGRKFTADDVLGLSKEQCERLSDPCMKVLFKDLFCDLETALKIKKDDLKILENPDVIKLIDIIYFRRNAKKMIDKDLDLFKRLEKYSKSDHIHHFVKEKVIRKPVLLQKDNRPPVKV